MNCDCRMTQKQAVWACFETIFLHLSARKWGVGMGKRMKEKTLQTNRRHNFKIQKYTKGISRQY